MPSIQLAIAQMYCKVLNKQALFSTDRYVSQLPLLNPMQYAAVIYA